VRWAEFGGRNGLERWTGLKSDATSVALCKSPVERCDGVVVTGFADGRFCGSALQVRF